MASSSAPVHPYRYLALFLVLLIGVYLLVFLTGDKHAKPKLGIDLQGGTRVTLTARTPDGSKPTRDALNQAQQIISARVNGLGVSGSEVVIDGDNLVITVPGNDGNEARNLGQTARLFIRPVIGQPIPVEAIKQQEQKAAGQQGGPGGPPPGAPPGASPGAPPAGAPAAGSRPSSPRHPRRRTRPPRLRSRVPTRWSRRPPRASPALVSPRRHPRPALVIRRRRPRPRHRRRPASPRAAARTAGPAQGPRRADQVREGTAAEQQPEPAPARRAVHGGQVRPGGRARR